MKKHFLTICILSALTFGFVSCDSKDDDTKQENTINNFVGNWSGTFSGEDAGTWSMKVQETGKVTGTLKYSSDNVELDLQGRVSENGTVTATTHYGTMDIGIFNGTMKANTASGIWTDTDADTEGTWKGTKN
ncbi:hypothetical protein H1R17_04395 [Flavobacterium sp. xlx-214]|uniref:hypothetical protein n=1 Tax=unclassified Flavobacterium TaxID=196869 RepID=UPI0013D5266E|nr:MULTISPECIES: hypothetical protein [unclassified Flavobacterium]MBA5792132.1 hypothetical protein [Flavobacterium sp. xlx-221]QMI84378.1 hypothetical protein H1R17_04395 [Flavobacterium sp. xlx-214]